MKNRLVVALLIILTPGLYAQEKKLSLDELVKLALERNPKIKSAAQMVESERFRISPEGALPDPVLSFGITNMTLTQWSVGSDPTSGVGVSVAQAFPFPGKLKLKSEIAGQREQRAEESLRGERLTVARRVKELYSRMYYFGRAHDLLLEKKGILENALRTAESKYTVGQGVQSDIIKAGVEISSLEEMINAMDTMGRSTKAALNGVLDYPSETSWETPAEIPFTAFPLELKQVLEEAAKNSPQLRSAGIMIQEGSLEVDMAKREYYPNFMVQIGKEFRGALPDMYEVMVGVEIPVFYKRKQARLVEESVSRLSGTKLDLTTMKNDLAAMLSESFLEAKNAERNMQLYKEKIIPQTALSLESSLGNYQVNKVDFLAVLSDINAVVSARMEYIKNQADLWAATARIEELTDLEILKTVGSPGQGGPRADNQD